MGCRGQYNKAVAQTFSLLSCKAAACCFLDVVPEISPILSLFSLFSQPSSSPFFKDLFSCLPISLSTGEYFSHRFIWTICLTYMLYLLQTPTQFPKPVASQQFTIIVTVPFTLVKKAIPFFPPLQQPVCRHLSACGWELQGGSAGCWDLSPPSDLDCGAFSGGHINWERWSPCWSLVSFWFFYMWTVTLQNTHLLTVNIFIILCTDLYKFLPNICRHPFSYRLIWVSLSWFDFPNANNLWQCVWSFAWFPA